MADSLDQIAFERKRLEELQAQIQREAEAMLVQCAEKHRVVLSEIERRENILAPKEANLKQVHAEASSRIESVSQREATVAGRESAIEQRILSLNVRESSLGTGESVLKEAELAHQQKVINELAHFKVQTESFEAEKAKHQDSVLLDRASLQDRESKLLDSEKEIQSRLDAANSALADWKALSQKNQEETAKKVAELQELEKTLSGRMEVVSVRESSAEKREHAIQVTEAGFSEHEQKLAATANGLEKCRIDLDIKQARLKKLELQISALIERNGLRDDLKKLGSDTSDLVSAPIEVPVGS